MNTTDRLLNRIGNEVKRQFSLWGQQDHPILQTGSEWLAQGRHESAAQEFKRLNALRVENDNLTWDGILLEEVHEALAERDPVAREEELLQVAAVALSMVAASERARQAALPESLWVYCSIPDCKLCA